MEERELIQRVWLNKKANQKLVTIPKDSEIKEKDFVLIKKIEFNSREIYRTDIEEIMYQALTKEDIEFSFQYPIRGKYGYIADFFIPSKKLIIECDGRYWHKKKRDNVRDNVLKKQGYKILRFTDFEIKNILQSCITKIMEEIK